MLANLEINRVIDLLLDRATASAADRLRDRPDVEIVARDRKGASAAGVRQGAPMPSRSPIDGTQSAISAGPLRFWTTGMLPRLAAPPSTSDPIWP